MLLWRKAGRSSLFGEPNAKIVKLHHCPLCRIVFCLMVNRIPLKFKPLKQMPQTFYLGGGLSSVFLISFRMRCWTSFARRIRDFLFFVCSKNVCCLNSDANRNIDMINTCINKYPLFKHDMT